MYRDIRAEKSKKVLSLLEQSEDSLIQAIEEAKSCERATGLLARLEDAKQIVIRCMSDMERIDTLQIDVD